MFGWDCKLLHKSRPSNLSWDRYAVAIVELGITPMNSIPWTGLRINLSLFIIRLSWANKEWICWIQISIWYFALQINQLSRLGMQVFPSLLRWAGTTTMHLVATLGQMVGQKGKQCIGPQLETSDISCGPNRLLHETRHIRDQEQHISHQDLGMGWELPGKPCRT